MEGSTTNGGVSILGNLQEDNKFTIVAADCSISSKEKTKTQRLTQAFIDIEFRKDSETSYFSYFIFQNYFCHQITIKQLVGKDKKDDKNWKTVLKNYTLMENPHFESDAQNWHIIGTELVSLNNFNPTHNNIDCYSLTKTSTGGL